MLNKIKKHFRVKRKLKALSKQDKDPHLYSGWTYDEIYGGGLSFTGRRYHREPHRHAYYLGINQANFKHILPEQPFLGEEIREVLNKTALVSAKTERKLNEYNRQLENAECRKCYTIYELRPAPWGDDYRFVEIFERYEDAMVVFKALQSVNIYMNYYKIIEENLLRNMKGVE